MRPIFLIVILFASTYAVLAQEADPPAPVNIDNIYLAKDDGTGKAGDAVSSFSPTDIPIYCVVTLDSNTPVTVKMNLVAAKVAGVKPDSSVLTVSYTTKDGQNRVNFTGKPAGKWVVGVYRVDIFLNDKFVKNVSFEVKPVSKEVQAAALLRTTTAQRSTTPRKKN